MQRYQNKAALLATVALALSSSTVDTQQIDLKAIAARDEALVQFFAGGTPLTPPEQAEIEAAVRQSFATNPQAAKAAASESEQLTILMKGRTAIEMAVLLQGGRRAIGFTYLQALAPQPLTATAARIVTAHDPVVASDSAKQYLVTHQTVRVLVEANRKAAPLFNVPAPPPGPAAVGTLAASIHANWPTIDDGLRESLSNAQRDLPFAEPYLAQSPPAARAKFIAAYHGKIMEGRDAAAYQFNLAEVISFVGKTGYQHRGSLPGNGTDAVTRARNNQSMYDRAGRSLMPGCGVAAGSVMSPERRQFCNPSPLP